MSQSGNYEGVNSQGNSYTSYEGDKNEYSYSNQDGSSYYNDGIKKLFLSIVMVDIFIMVFFPGEGKGYYDNDKYSTEYDYDQGTSETTYK